MSAKTPEEYIEKSLKSKLSAGLKGNVTTEWLAHTGFSAGDLSYARNRNPYWRKVKAKGSYNRNQERIQKFNFKKSEDSPKKIWTMKDVEEFSELDKTMTDRELAKEYKTTLPAINHIRRKLKLSKDILELKKEKLNTKKVVSYSMRSEKLLREELAILKK